MPGKISRISIVIILLFSFSRVSGQGDDYSWWNKKHNWDGTTNWMYYLIYAPAYFGPNALPVPEIRDARIDTLISFESSLDFHFSTGDNTQDLFLKLRYPFLNGRVAIEFFGVPIEHFEMDTITRDERVVRDYYAKGYAAGDLYIGTMIQLLRDHGKWPDLLLGISLRTASGGNLGNARFTDAPGYYFDLSMGKSFNLSTHFKIRPYAMIGFYVWQTNRDDWRQNDSFLYGLGLSAYSDKWEFSTKWGGYKGYIGNGDAPSVIRANMLYRISKMQLKFAFQQGLTDFEYSSIRLGTVFSF